MKKILTLIAVASMSLSLFATDIFSYVPLTANVKSYTKTEFTINSKFGSYFRTQSKQIVRVLNNLGKEVEITELSSRNTVDSKIINTYDVYGNLTEQNCYDDNSQLLWKNIITYKDGIKSELAEYSADNTLKSKTIYTYDKGQLKDESIYNGDGSLFWKYIYGYNENGSLAYIDEYPKSGDLERKTSFSYKEDGGIDSILYFDTLTNSSIHDIFRYAEDGKVFEVVSYDQNKEVIKRTLVKYDSMGNINKITAYDVSQKFGGVHTELVEMSDYSYNY